MSQSGQSVGKYADIDRDTCRAQSLAVIAPLKWPKRCMPARGAARLDRQRAGVARPPPVPPLRSRAAASPERCIASCSDRAMQPEYIAINATPRHGSPRWTYLGRVIAPDETRGSKTGRVQRAERRLEQKPRTRRLAAPRTSPSAAPHFDRASGSRRSSEARVQNGCSAPRVAASSSKSRCGAFHRRSNAAPSAPAPLARAMWFSLRCRIR